MVTKQDIVSKVIEIEFTNTSLTGKDVVVLEMLLCNYRYVFDRHYHASTIYEGSKSYWQLYSCITGILNDLLGTDEI
ncbi:MAG: hypothetical protein IKT74_01655 [Bacteroidales bacterium]|nr:hypothetical protein [Bacteroidales bacterium]